MLNVVDNFLTEEEYYLVDKVRFIPGYEYGEHDCYPEKNPIMNGMSLTLNPDNEIYILLDSKIRNMFSEVNELTLNRLYVNCFAPSEWSYYHTDRDEGYSITFLYYLNSVWDINDGGETHFYINNEITTIPPIPNRLVYFDGTLLHKATPFRDRHRFTVAIKYHGELFKNN
jgi:hypothetical protein